MRAPVPRMAVEKPFCYGLPGAIAPAGEFDPLGFSANVDELEMMRLREAELTHGRVGMLAAAGFLVQENFHPLFGYDNGPAIMQEKELSHGRIGMIAAAGFMAQEAVTGQTWGAEDNIMSNLLLGGWFATPGAMANL